MVRMASFNDVELISVDHNGAHEAMHAAASTFIPAIETRTPETIVNALKRVEEQQPKPQRDTSYAARVTQEIPNMPLGKKGGFEIT